MPLQIALLRRAEGLVEQDFGGTSIQREQLDLIGLAAADEERSIRGLASAADASNRLQARRLREQTQFLQVSIKIRKPEINPHQKHEGSRVHRSIGRTQLAGLSSDSLVAKFTARPGTMVEIACL
jgi:hypothetical protein